MIIQAIAVNVEEWWDSSINTIHRILLLYSFHNTEEFPNLSSSLEEKIISNGDFNGKYAHWEL